MNRMLWLLPFALFACAQSSNAANVTRCHADADCAGTLVCVDRTCVDPDEVDVTVGAGGGAASSATGSGATATSSASSSQTSSVASSSHASSSASSSSTGGAASCDGSGSCDTCANCVIQPGAACVIQAMQCANNSECIAIIDCMNACAAGDTACPQGCFDAHPTGQIGFNTYVQCVLSACANDCA